MFPTRGRLWWPPTKGGGSKRRGKPIGLECIYKYMNEWLWLEFLLGVDAVFASILQGVDAQRFTGVDIPPTKHYYRSCHAWQHHLQKKRFWKTWKMNCNEKQFFFESFVTMCWEHGSQKYFPHITFVENWDDSCLTLSQGHINEYDYIAKWWYLSNHVWHKHDMCDNMPTYLNSI